MRKNSLILTFAILFTLSFSIVYGGSIRLSWNPVNSSALAGYRVYYGYESGIYTFSYDAGNATSCMLNSLQDCVTHYLVVTSYDYYGQESGYSNEVSGFPRPTLDTLSPLNGLQGRSITVTFSGMNFDNGSYPQFESEDIQLTDYYINGCDEIVAEIMIKGGPDERPAETGSRPAYVMNSIGIVSTPTANFEVQLNEDLSKELLNYDKNARIDGYDLNYFAQHFASQEGEEDYDPLLDVNGDRQIDGDDLAIFAMLFGQSVS